MDIKKHLTAPNLLMLGVVAIGGFAAYRLLKGKGGGDTSGLAMLGDPLHLVQGRYYRGRLRVHDVGVPPFVTNADQGTLQSALQVLGFSDVKVYMDPASLPSDWPKGTIGNSDATARWFVGRWAQGTANLPRPADVELMWVSSPPAQGNAVAGVGPMRGGAWTSVQRPKNRGMNAVERVEPGEFASNYAMGVISP